MSDKIETFTEIIVREALFGGLRVEMPDHRECVYLTAPSWNNGDQPQLVYRKNTGAISHPEKQKDSGFDEWIDVLEKFGKDVSRKTTWPKRSFQSING